MAKFINKKIEVSCSPKGTPAAFRFNGKVTIITKVLDIWKDTGCWWNGEAEKMFYRAEAGGSGPSDSESNDSGLYDGPSESWQSAGGLYEFFLDIEHQVWYLYKTYD